MPRPQLDVGTHGNIRVTGQPGKYVAFAQFRDLDGAQEARARVVPVLSCKRGRDENDLRPVSLLVGRLFCTPAEERGFDGRRP